MHTDINLSKTGCRKFSGIRYFLLMCTEENKKSLKIPMAKNYHPSTIGFHGYWPKHQPKRQGRPSCSFFHSHMSMLFFLSQSDRFGLWDDSLSNQQVENMMERKKWDFTNNMVIQNRIRDINPWDSKTLCWKNKSL